MHSESQKGNVLFYILIAVVLLGALSYTMSRNSGEQTSVSVQATRIAEELNSQALLIRTAILECVLVNNFGYPATVSTPVKDLECQIDNIPTYRPIFTGTASRVLPLPPKPFGDWVYSNDGAGNISLSIEAPGSAAGQAGVISGLNQLKANYAPEEITVINDGSSASFILHVTKTN